MSELAENTDLPRTERPARTVLFVDELPLRREAYLCWLTHWARDHDLALKSESFEDYKGALQNAALLILSGGDTSIDELRLRAELVGVDLKATPLVVISDRDEPSQVTEAIALGARGYLPTTLSGELALKTLTFILGGGDFFPPSALTASGEGLGSGRRRDMLG